MMKAKTTKTARQEATKENFHDLANFVFHRAQRSIYLLESLRQAMADADHPELVDLVDLVLQDAGASKEASHLAMVMQKRSQVMDRLEDLRSLIGPLPPGKEQAALRLANHIEGCENLDRERLTA